MMKQAGMLIILLILLCIGNTAVAQSIHRLEILVSLADGSQGGLHPRTNIIQLLQHKDGLYVLTERKGCYLLPSGVPPDEESIVLLAQPQNRHEQFNRLVSKDETVYLLVDYHQLRPLNAPLQETIQFTSAFFSEVLQPTDIHYNTDGCIIVGTGMDGLFVFSPDEYGNYTDVPIRISTVDDQLPSNEINTLYEDNNGALWIGTGQGLVAFYRDSIYDVTAKPVSEKTCWEKLWGAKVQEYPYQESVSAITQWGDNIIFTSDNNLFKVNSRLDAHHPIYSFPIKERLGLEASPIEQMVVDINGEIWLASNQLFRYNIATDALSLWSKTDGLLGQQVHSIVEGTIPDLLWVGTQRGGLHKISLPTDEADKH